MKLLGFRSKSKRKMFLASFVYSFAFLLIMMIVIIAMIDPETKTANSSANAIESVVIDELDETTNNDKDTYIKHKNEEGRLEVNINSSDNLTTGMTVDSMHNDAIKLFPALFEESSSDSIRIFWHMTLVNKKGNESEESVMQMTFTRDNADTINWGNMSMDNLPAVADDYWKHPAIQK